MQRNAALIPVLAVAAVVFSACDELPAAPEETPPKAVASYATTLWDPCFVYEPCLIGGIWVITRRRLEDEVKWPEGIECGGIPGGCFTPSGIVFGREPYMAPRGNINPPGTKYARYGARGPTGTESRDMQRALNDLKRRWPDCAPIADMMSDRLGSGGIWMANRNNASWGGEWVREEGMKGVVYISYEPGLNWDSSGTPFMRDLRKTLTEEGIHAWFDQEVGHGSLATDEEKAAMAQAREECGYWSTT